MSYEWEWVNVECPMSNFESEYQRLLELAPAEPAVCRYPDDHSRLAAR